MKKILGLVLLLSASPLVSEDVYFGLNTSEWADDGVCDDRRFIGEPSLIARRDHADNLQDAEDCKKALEADRITYWQSEESFAKLLEDMACDEAEFGNDTGSYPEDGECDDPRFEGIGMASSVSGDEAYSDASDCKELCARNMIFYLGEPETE